MKITFDKEADAVYIEFSSGEFAFYRSPEGNMKILKEFTSNKKIDDNTIVDLDKEGNILGIEILSVSETMPNDFLSNVTIKNLVSV